MQNMLCTCWKLSKLQENQALPVKKCICNLHLSGRLLHKHRALSIILLCASKFISPLPVLFTGKSGAIGEEHQQRHKVTQTLIKEWNNIRHLYYIVSAFIVFLYF